MQEAKPGAAPRSKSVLGCQGVIYLGPFPLLGAAASLASCLKPSPLLLAGEWSDNLTL